MIRINRFLIKKIFVYGVLITAWFFLAVYNCWGIHAVFCFPENSIEERSIVSATSTNFRLDKKFQGTIRRYQVFGEMYQAEDSPAVPGLSYTQLGDSYSRQMVPQGLCIAGDYMLITAYDCDTEGKPSVIYVLSNKEGTQREYLTTLVLPDSNHVGGITFDGTYIWIAKSSTGFISGIPYEEIEAAVRSGKGSCRVKNYEKQIYLGITASFVTWEKGRMWVGTHVSGFGNTGELSCFRLNYTEEEITAEKEYSIQIPAYAQGVAFTEWNQKTYMVLTSSWGRYRDSTVYLYETIDGIRGMCINLAGTYRFPPMAEELVSDGTNMYFLFESAATCYSNVRYGKCVYPVDRICGVQNQKLFLGFSRVR